MLKNSPFKMPKLRLYIGKIKFYLTERKTYPSECGGVVHPKLKAMYLNKNLLKNE